MINRREPATHGRSHNETRARLRHKKSLKGRTLILGPDLIHSGNVLTHTTNKLRTDNLANSEALNLQILLNSRDLKVVRVTFMGDLDHNPGIPDHTNGLTLGVVDEVEDVADILVEVGVTENILAEEGVTLFVGDEGEAPAHQNSSLFCLGLTNGLTLGVEDEIEVVADTLNILA